MTVRSSRLGRRSLSVVIAAAVLATVSCSDDAVSVDDDQVGETAPSDIREDRRRTPRRLVAGLDPR